MTIKLHTSGPWRPGNPGTGSVISDHNNGLHKPGNEDEHLKYYGGKVIAETVAQCNISIISAAPELLECLKTIVGRMDFSSKEKDAAIAAIAKAEGDF